MKAGFGRGYYGTAQLASSPPRQRSWFKIVAFVGVGAAAVWLLWPRSSLPAGVDGGRPKTLPPIPPADALPAAAHPAALPAALSAATATPMELPATSSAPSETPEAATGAFLKQVEDDARARGYVSPEDYENAVVTTARQLQETGAKIVLAPHLQHLARRIGA